MDPRPCIVTLDDREVHGTVLAWVREQGQWWAVVRYRAEGPGGFIMNYERRLPASVLRPRED